jgi:hypothetical protein
MTILVVMFTVAVLAGAGIAAMCKGSDCGKKAVETPLSKIQERDTRNLEWERALRR